MKIAFVSTILDYPWGGADTLWTHAAEVAHRRGDRLLISVSSLVAGSPRVSALRAAGAVIHVQVAPSIANSVRARLERKLSMLSGHGDSLLPKLTAFQPDVVVFSLGGSYDLIAHPAWLDWLRTTRTRYRVIANWQKEHPTLRGADYTLARESLTAAEQVNFVSTRNLEVTRRHLLDPLPNARVIHNPLRWTPNDRSPWPASSVLRMATVSRLDESKGIQLLLHAIADVCAKEPNWELNIYGEGPAEGFLRSTATHLQLNDHVHFHGFVRELRSIWTRNQLMISPSIEDGVPMTIPEAMLCERPVLATAVGGAEDWLTHGETGFICPAPTLPLLRGMLQSALDARHAWLRFGQAAAFAAHERYRPDDFLRLIDPC